MQRYWIYLRREDVTMIHHADWVSCRDGRGVEGEHQVKRGWFGPYATTGAAKDGAETFGEIQVKEDTCVRHRRAQVDEPSIRRDGA